MNQEQHIEINNTIESLDNSIKVATELRDKLLKEIEDNKAVKVVENINIIDRKIGVNYFYLNMDKDVCETDDEGTPFEEDRLNTFNYFLTEEEAQKVAKRELLSRKVLLVRDKARNNWIPIKQDPEFCELIYNSEGISIAFSIYYTDSRTTLTFKNVEQIDLFRKMITDKEIIEYLNI